MTAMTPEAQRVAIAAACGWEPSEAWAKVATETHCVYRRGDELRTTKELLDYPNDLNAMHEAEASLSHERLLAFDRHLYDLFISAQYQHCIHATASQRAEAFLKTIGKWTP